MIAAFLLLGAIVWLCIAAAAGWLAYRQTHKRWLQVTVSLFVLWLPFWDVIPGLYFYYKAIREVGGVRIYRTVKAEGYLDRTATDCYSCWTELLESPYKYLEIHRTVPWGTLASVEAGAGYYEYRVLPKGSVGCESFESLSNADQIRTVHGLRDRCVSFLRRATPNSRYEVSAETRRWPWGVDVYSRRIRDMQEDQTLSESNQVYFIGWLGRKVGVPAWEFNEQESGVPIRFRNTDVLVP